jgi:hypothetical protein
MNWVNVLSALCFVGAGYCIRRIYEVWRISKGQRKREP